MDDDIFRISKDILRAKDLVEMALERLKDIISILPRSKPYKILEEYYEIIVQLITSIMYADGYKTLSHISLINFIKNNYKEISNFDLDLIEQMRKFRHGTVYYGKKISEGFLINNEVRIRKIISLLTNMAKNKTK